MKRYRIPQGITVHLDKMDPDDTGDHKKTEQGKEQAKAMTSQLIGRLGALQERLYANGERSVLVVLQGMDTSGKDGTIKSVMSGVNPQGCRVASFKVPSDRERAHDFLWRVHYEAPPKGHIGIFNRSHYEDVLITRVHGWVSEDLYLAWGKCKVEIWTHKINGLTESDFYLAAKADREFEPFRVATS
ncbi:MAG: hypothetical protein HP477_06185 [Nitrospira sp.]|nr:hypothetical protein [Nitrospira sp.]